MLVELKRLESNPLRDFTIDPVDEARVKALTTSIEEDGFWGGIVCRRLKSGVIQIAAGQHRVDAAIAAGIKSADVFVASEMDDADLVRIYSRENATQRGNSGTAQAGTIAAAIRFLSRQLATGLYSPRGEYSPKSWAKSITHFSSGEGIGQDLVEDLLVGIPGVTSKMVEQQLANLKAAGQYARIVGEVKEEIERENRDALKELERREKVQRVADEAARKAEEERKVATARAKAAKEVAEKQRALLAQQRAETEAKLAEKRRQDMQVELAKFDALRKTRDILAEATETAEQREVTFDHLGVSEWLTIPAHVSEFRRLVTSPTVQAYCKVSQQAKLARDLVAEARSHLTKGQDVTDVLTLKFIKDHIYELAQYGRTERKRADADDREARERAHLTARYSRLIEEMGASLRAIVRTGTELADLEKSWPKTLAKPISRELQRDVALAKKIIDKLNSIL